MWSKKQSVNIIFLTCKRCETRAPGLGQHYNFMHIYIKDQYCSLHWAQCLFHCQKHFLKSRTLVPSNTAWNSAWISVIYLRPLNWIVIFRNKKTLERTFCPLWHNLSGPCILHQFCFWSTFSRERAQNFQQVAPCIKLLLKCINMYCMIGPVNLMDDLLHCFCILTSPTSQWMTTNFQNLNQSWENFDTEIPSKSISYIKNHQIKLSEAFIISQKVVSQGHN